MKFIRTTLRSLLLIRETPEKTALAFSVGVFCGFSPFMGFHTILGLVTAIAFRLNKTAVLIGVFMNSPWLLAPYYTFATCSAFSSWGCQRESLSLRSDSATCWEQSSGTRLPPSGDC